MGDWWKTPPQVLPFEGYTKTLTVSRNILISNGIDALGIRDMLLTKQKLAIENKKNGI